MSGQDFPKERRLLARSQFQRVFQRGCRTCRGSLLLVSYRNTLGYSRLGVAIGRKTGKAVVRNRLKRRIREIFRRDGSIDALSRDIVIVVRRKSVGGLCFAALRNDFKTCITQLNLRC